MKKKLLKTLSCLTLATLMFLTACTGNSGGKNKKGQAEMGGYKEEEVVMPKGYSQVSNAVFLPDGKMVVVGQRYIDYESIYRESEMPSEAATDATGTEVEPETSQEPTAEEPTAEEPTTEEPAKEKDAEQQTDEAATEEEPATELPPSGEAQEFIRPKEQFDLIAWDDLTKEPTVDPLELPENSYFSNNALMLDAQGNVVLVMNGYDPEKQTNKFSVYTLNGPKGAGKDATAVPPVSSFALDLGDMHPNSYTMLANGDIAVCDYTGLRIFDSKGNKVKELAAGSFTYQVTANKDHLIALNGDSSELVHYDIQTYSELFRVPVRQSIFGNLTSVKALDDGSIYFFGQDGVKKMDAPQKDGDKYKVPEVQYVLNSIDYKLSEPGRYIQSFSMTQDNQIIAIGSMDGNNMIGGYRRATAVSVATSDEEGEAGPKMFGYVYTWDPTIDNSDKVELEITAMFSDQMLLTAASIFREKHPNVRIRITQYYDKMEKDMKWSDLIKSINTDILSGKGGDVMFLDNMPIQSYMRRGVLVDLEDLITELGGEENLNMGVINGMRNDEGKLYAIPMWFQTYALYGRKDAIKQVTDLKSILDINVKPDQRILASMQRNELFQLLLISNLPAFIDEKTGNYRFDSPEFINFLELFDRIYNEAQEPPYELPENPTEEDFRKYDEMYTKNRLDLYKGNIAMQISYLYGIDSLDFTMAGGEDADWTFLPTVKDMGGAVYTPNNILGINAKSDQKELAAEFIKLLFSGDERLHNYVWGFLTIKSVQERAIQQQLERYKEQDENGWGNTAWIGGPDNVEVPAYRMTEQQMRDMVAKLDQCTIPNIYDNTLMEFLNEEVEPFLNKTKSATEVAQSLQKRAAAYLAE